MASHSQPFSATPTTGPATLQANQPPVLPESAGASWALRDPLRPSAAGNSSLWAKEAADFGGRQLWGCAHCGSTATRFKGLRDHHSGRHGDLGMHRDHPFEAFTCCINNPDRPTPRQLIPEIRAAATEAIYEGRVLPYNLQRFNQFYTGPPLPAYPLGRVPTGLTTGPALAPASNTLPYFPNLPTLNQHPSSAGAVAAPPASLASAIDPALVAPSFGVGAPQTPLPHTGSVPKGQQLGGQGTVTLEDFSDDDIIFYGPEDFPDVKIPGQNFQGGN